MSRRSYSSLPGGLRRRVQELVHLQRMHRRRAPTRAANIVDEMAWLREQILDRYGIELDGQRMLDIGGGQLLPAALYFAQTNDVVSIDQAFVPRPGEPTDYVRMLRRNGPVRTMKTLGRKALGVDRVFRNSLADLVDVEKLRNPTLWTADAADVDAEDESFDVVYSFSVFEHLDDPPAVVAEASRLLRRGGVAILHVHPFTSENGAHDPRVMSGDRRTLPLWAHLRPQHRELVASNAYLNEWGVDRWRELFASMLPGSDVVLRGDDDPARRVQLAALQRTGELEGYNDDELLNADLYCFWQRPVHDATD